MSQASNAIDAWLAALPGAGELIFWPPPAALYTVAELYRGFAQDDPASWREAWDTQVFNWTMGADGHPRDLSPAEAVAARLHDAQIDRLVRDFIDHENSVTIGIMGGHDIPRDAAAYAQVVHIARDLRRRQFKIVTGGGPGLMEAANLGAFLAPCDDDTLDWALKTLGAAPDYASHDPAVAEQQKSAWIAAAAEVRARILGDWNAPSKPGGESLGLPTWYYGSEPPNLFASACGKYFMNSLREDGLVSVADGGLIFGKGSAGTVQEVFQNASYNYYRGRDRAGKPVQATPMVFLGADFWNPAPTADATPSLDPGRKPLFPLVQKLAADAAPPFIDSLLLSDDPHAITRFLIDQNADRIKPARLADLCLSRANSIRPRRRT